MVGLSKSPSLTYPKGELLLDLSPRSSSCRLPVLNECCDSACACASPAVLLVAVMSSLTLPRRLGLGLGFGDFFLITPKLKNLQCMVSKDQLDVNIVFQLLGQRL